MRSRRAQAAWKVITHIRRETPPTSEETRSRISSAALLVKVIARIWFGCARPVASSQAIRCVRARVLPDPAPARISSGPSPKVTASRCGPLRPASRRSTWSAPASIGAPGVSSAASSGATFNSS